MAYSVLDKISYPGDLKSLSSSELTTLAGEIRDFLVNMVSETGGHLASNLGIVELTLALHLAFETPKDKIVWDVGHQAYVHKLLTGRKDQFHTLRQFGGLSGFPERGESPHDAFSTGHASTSVSAALGLAVARDLRGEDFNVIAVIGDGAMTGGMAFEALNQAGHLGTGVIVILNDNQMSISPNVGALSGAFNRMRLDKRYHKAKEGAQSVITRFPLGSQMVEAGKRFKRGLKGMVIPTMIWEELGFSYIGPVDGHDMTAVLAALSTAKSFRGQPTFVHVMTKKGKGYDPAEDDAIGFHGVAPNGASKAPAPSYTKIFSQAVLDIARKDSRVVAITAAMLEGTGLSEAAKEMPTRVFDTGICEDHAVTFAAGIATQGIVPIVAIYSTFMQRSVDQVLHDVCIQNLPVVFALDRAGIVGDDGKTHQGAFDLSLFRTIPNAIVCSPKDENELRHLLFTGVMSGSPFFVRYPRGAGIGVPLDPELHEIAIGSGEELRSGGDVALLAIGNTVYPSLEAATRLENVGIKATVINSRFVKPLDEKLILKAARKCRRILTIEENVLAGGFGSAVLELLQREGLGDIEVHRLGIPDEFVEHGPQELFRKRYKLDATGIFDSVLTSFSALANPKPLIIGAQD